MTFSICSSKSIVKSALLLIFLLCNSYAVKIGILLPLKCELFDFAKSVKNGVEIAVNDYNLHSLNKVTLLIKETDGTSEDTQKLFSELTNDEECIAVIGPLTSNCVISLKDLTEEKKILLLTPTASDKRIYNISPYIFSIAFTSQIEARGIAEYVIDEKMVKRFAVISPKELYPMYLVENFEKEINLAGATLIAKELYDSGKTDFKDEILKLGGIDPEVIKDIDKKDEKRFKKILSNILNRIKDYLETYDIISNRVVNIRSVNVTDKAKKYNIDTVLANIIFSYIKRQSSFKVTMTNNDFYPSVLYSISEIIDDDIPVFVSDYERTDKFNIKIDVLLDENEQKTWNFEFEKSAYPKSNPFNIEAIYIPSEWKSAIQIVSQLIFYNIETLVVGASTWKNVALLEYGNIKYPNLIPVGFFLESERKQVKDFIKKYMSSYALSPDLFSASGYDSANLLLSSIENGNTTRDSIYNDIRNKQKFSGVTGIITFDYSNVANRIFPIISARNKKWVRINK